MSKIGRNDSCPCGSGKKYKKCCINIDNTIIPSSNFNSEYFKIKAERDSFIRDNNLNVILTTSVEILYDENEEEINREKFLEVVENIEKDNRFKIFKYDDKFDWFYSYFEIMYLSSDCVQLNKDYSILKNTDFFNGNDLVDIDTDFKRSTNRFYNGDFEMLKKVGDYLNNIEWRTIDIHSLITELKYIGITIDLIYE